MTRLKMKFAIVLLLSNSIIALSQDIQFADMTNLPEARSALTSANDGENIYVVNGFGVDAQYTEEVYKYDISQNSWSVLTSSTIPKRFASAEIIGDYLYVFNGVSNGQINSSVEKIDINNGSIEFLSDNPQPCKAAGVSAWNNKIYSFGGTLHPTEYSNKLYEFDPQNDIWTELTDIPFAGETKGEIIDGKLYIIGGYNGAVSDRIDVYNLTTNTWESNITMPVSVSAHSTAIIGSKIYIVGDYSNLTFLAYFDTSDNSFQILTNNLNERRHCAAEGVDGHLFAIGGNTISDVGSSISSVQKSDISLSINEASNIQIIKSYPNPTTNILNLNNKYEELCIYNNQGKKIRRFTNVSNINVTDLNSGVYFIQGKIGLTLYQTKIIKE